MNILLLYASWGWGHKKAALALEEAFAAKGMPAESKDLLDFLPPALASFYSASYSTIVSHWRGLWRWMYETTDRHGNGYSPHKSVWQSWQFEPLLRFLSAGNYTHIVSTHFTTSALLAGWREKYGWNHKIFSVVTDYVAHRYWKRRGLDHYFVPTEDVAAQLMLAGLNPAAITASGIPISQSFLQTGSPRENIRQELCSDPAEKLVLVLTSGFNMASTRRLIEDLSVVKAHFLISAGKDAPREASIRNLCGTDTNFTVFGITTRMADFMKAADLLISKPGGITTSEALASGLPLVLLAPIPGQEEGNAQFLVRSGAAVRPLEERGDLIRSVASLLEDERQLRLMAERATSLGRPRASETIVERVLRERI